MRIGCGHVCVSWPVQWAWRGLEVILYFGGAGRSVGRARFSPSLRTRYPGRDNFIASSSSSWNGTLAEWSAS